MKIVLRQMTVSLVSFGQSAAEAVTSALSVHGHNAMKVVKISAEPMNPEQNKETADLFEEFMLDTARIVPGFQQGNETQGAYMVTLVLEDSITWQPKVKQPADQAELPLGEGGGMAGTTAAVADRDEAASSSPGTAPASGTLAEPGTDLHTNLPPEVPTDPSDRDPASVPVSSTQANRPPQPTVIAGLPPEAVQVGGSPAPAVEGENETLPTPGQA